MNLRPPQARAGLRVPAVEGAGSSVKRESWDALQVHWPGLREVSRSSVRGAADVAPRVAAIFCKATPGAPPEGSNLESGSDTHRSGPAPVHGEHRLPWERGRWLPTASQERVI